jgi:imidazolonepropionase-like amidohydrolase
VGTRPGYGPPMAPSRLVLRGARLVDGTGADPVEDAVVVVEGDRIAQVGGSAPGDAAEVDLSGATLLPGLIDAHAHLTLIDAGDMAFERMSAAVAAARIFENCRLALRAGFTTVRDAGGADAGLVIAVASGLVEGPRILPSGPVLCQTGGHGDFRHAFAHHPEGEIPGLASGSLVCDGPAEARQAAREAFRRGATQIKVCVSGGVVSHTDRLEDAQFSVDELRAIVEEAEARDTYVLAHSHNVRGIRNGLAAGIRSFEHATFLDPETAAAIAEAGAYIVPTLTVVRLLAELGPSWGLTEEIVARAAGVEEAMTGAVKIAADAGVKIGSGSDLLGIEQDRRGLELTLKSRIIGPMAAVVSATRVNAELLGLGDEVGTVTEGKAADLVAFDGDPMADPELFDAPDKVRLVVQGGRVVRDG